MRNCGSRLVSRDGGASPRPPGGSQRRAAVCRNACLSTLLATACGCTVLQPIQPPPDDEFPFPLANMNVAPVRDSAASDAQFNCTRLFVPERDTSAGGLQTVMAKVDVRRRALVCRAASSTNAKGLYNALIWPLAVGALADQALHAPTRSLIIPTALALGAYEMLSSSIPDREKSDLLAARRLACSIVRAAPKLYPATDLDENEQSLQPQAGRAFTAVTSPSLGLATSRLHRAVESFDIAHAEFVASLPPPPKSAMPGDFVEKIMARGRAGPARDTRPQIEALVDAWEKQAKAIGDEAEVKIAQIRGAASELWNDSVSIEINLQSDLTSRQPALVTPGAAFGAASAAFGTSTVPSATVASGHGRQVLLQPNLARHFTTSMYDAMPASVRSRMSAFDRDTLSAVVTATEQVNRILDVQDAREEIAMRQTSDCPLTALPIIRPAAPAVSAPQASRPSTPATPSGSTTQLPAS